MIMLAGSGALVLAFSALQLGSHNGQETARSVHVRKHWCAQCPSSGGTVCVCVVDIAAVETDRHRQRRLASLLPPVFLCRRVDGGSCRSTVTFRLLPPPPVYVYFKTLDLSNRTYIHLSIFTILRWKSFPNY